MMARIMAVQPRAEINMTKVSLKCGVLMMLVPALTLAAEQPYPVKPIRLIVPTSPGGGVDLTGRVLAKALIGIIGQSVVVENRPGVGGIPGSEFVAKAAPDGYTLLVASSSHVVNPSLYRKLPYDSIKDFSTISMVTRTPSVLVVHPSVPVKSVKDLISLVKANPGKLNYASAGAGQASHLAGTGPAVVGLLGGEVDLQFASLSSVLAHVKSGRLRALGMATTKRSSVMPELVTIAEAGVPGYEAGSWQGILAPAGVSREIVAQLNRAIVQSIDTPDMQETMRREGSDPAGNRPEEFTAFITAEIQKWAEVVKSAGIKAE
jgi:tripartite-type tricarboxylate transporter receptor subunit TctC